MRVSAKTPEGRLRKFCILRARQFGHGAHWVRGIASELFGIPPQEGFCLTALTKVQLVQLGDRVVTLTGGTPGQHRMGSTVANRKSQIGNGLNVVRMATVDQLQLVKALQEELRMSEDELAGVVRKALGAERKGKIRTTLDGVKVLQALRAIRGRRMAAAAQEAQQAAGSRQPVAG